VPAAAAVEPHGDAHHRRREEGAQAGRAEDVTRPFASALVALVVLAAGSCARDVASGAPTPVAAPAPTAPAPQAAAPVATVAGKVQPAAPAANGSPVPLLWRVSDADNTVYLLGSFHALRPTDYPLAPAVEAAFADAEQVRFELSPEEMLSPELGVSMATAAQLPEGETLRSVLAPATWDKLEAWASSRGLPLETFMGMEPWFVSLVITVMEMQRIQLDPAQGLDRHLIDRAVAAGKHTGGLETAAEQIAALDSMSREEQQQALLEALGEADDFRTEMEALHTAWRNGDDRTLYDRMGLELRQKYPRLYQRIDVDRNRAWFPEIRALLDDSHDDDALVVVGSLHLLGDDGVVEMLRAQGYKVERVR
jgi:uncharacterized protein YbaP (TraB family)